MDNTIYRQPFYNLHILIKNIFTFPSQEKRLKGFCLSLLLQSIQ